MIRGLCARRDRRILEIDADGSLVTPSGLVVAPGEPFDLGGGTGRGVPDHAVGGACLERTEDVWLVTSEL